MENQSKRNYSASLLNALLHGALVTTLFVVSLPNANAAAVWPAYLPPIDKAEWDIAEPAALGWNVPALDKLVSFAKTQHSTGLLIVQDGRIISEHYWPLTRFDALTRPRFYYFLSHGHTQDGQPIEDVASVQKSLVSILVGIAVGKRLIDMDAPVSRYLGKGWSKAGDTESSILVRHLLSMDSGLDTHFGPTHPAGTFWRYNTRVYSRLIPVLEAVTHQNIERLTKAWVFDRIGMHDSHWVVRPRSIWAPGHANLVGFYTTPRDLARLGLLVMMGGKWGKLDIVGNDQWFPLSVSPSQQLNPAYGFLWWLNGTTKNRISVKSAPRLREGPLIPTAPRDLIIAMGHEQRRLYISPGHKLVIVRFGGDTGRGFDNQFWLRATAALPGTPVFSHTGQKTR